MANLTQADMLNKLYKEYGLVPEDVFTHKHYKIITRAGIDKIQAAAKIDIFYSIVHKERHPGGIDVAVKATGYLLDPETGKTLEQIETFGEASPENTTQNYPFAMAEKRAMARAVLKLAGLYAHGFFSEDESDDFSKVVRGGTSAPKITYKGK
jgi:hypothetical protein